MRGEALATVLVCTAIGFACATVEPSEPVPTGRLPQDTRPLAYRLELEIDPRGTRFAGRVEIDVSLERARDVVWLHGSELDVAQAWVALPGDRRVSARFEPVDPSGVAALRLDGSVGPGPATLVLLWDAPFAPGLRGLYRVESGGDAYAFTQMEPIDARRVLPCFDEPAFKAPFEVSLVVREDDVALANTPEQGAEPLGDGRVRRRYAPTPPLPTYLLAWAVGPLDVVEAPAIPPNAVRDRPLPLRGVATRGRGAELAWALEHTPRIVAEVERYVGMPHPFAKLDVVAVPDFSAGAMENAGLVTFRDALLLVDPATAPERQRRGFASVMAHEIAHMWFGNLVTMPWWDDIWLNESFATWLAAKTVERLYPEHRSDLSRVEATHHAMDADSLASARRVREPIRTTHDIRSAFDPITYQKGGAVLGMFERAAGADRFRDAVRAYLAAHAGGTATGGDFLAALEDALGRELAEAARSFLDQPGLPLLTIEPRCSDPDARDGGRWQVRQARYVPLGSRLSDAGVWGVPLCLASGSCPLLVERDASVPTGAECGAPLHPNPGATGYYRWSLPAEELGGLLEAAWDASSATDRMSIADALLASYETGAQSAATVLAAFPRLAGDATRPVALAPLPILREARLHLAIDPEERARVERYVRDLYGARARSLGFDDGTGDPGERKLLRAGVVSAVAIDGRDTALRAEARERGRRHLLAPAGAPDPNAASPDLLGLVARVAVEDGGGEEFEAAWAHLFASDDAIVRGRMLHALAFARDPKAALRARSLVLDPRLRTNERMAVLSAQAEGAEDEAGRREILDWARAREREILEALTQPQAARLLGVAGGLCSASGADEVEAWMADRIDTFPGGPRRLAMLLERIRLCAVRTDAQRASARAFFASRSR